MADIGTIRKKHKNIEGSSMIRLSEVLAMALVCYAVWVCLKLPHNLMGYHGVSWLSSFSPFK